MNVLPHPAVKVTGTCLPVGEDCAVVAFKHVVHQAEGGLLVDYLLRCLRAEHVVEGKTLGLILFIGLEDGDLLVLFVHFDHIDTVCLNPFVLFSFSLVLMGRQRTITFTDSAIQ